LESTHPEKLSKAWNLMQISLQERRLVHDVDENEEDQVNVAFSQVLHALLVQHSITDKEFNVYRQTLLEMAENLEGMMLDLYDKTSQRPNTASMNARIALFGTKKNLQGARTLLDTMIKAEDNGNSLISPNTISYNIAVNAFAKSGQVASAREITLLMVSRWQEGKSTTQPDIVTFNSLIDAYAKSEKKDAGREAERILDWIDDLRSSGLSIFPNDLTYTAIINAHSKSATPERAELILNRLLQKQAQGANVKSTIYTFTAVLNAMSLTKDADAPERADKLISFIWELNKRGVDIIPDTEAYNAFLTVWTRRAKGPVAATKCWNILREMKDNPNLPKPSRITYEIVLSSLGYRDERNIRLAETLIREMKSSSDPNLWPKIRAYNTFLNVLSMQHSKEANSKALSTFQFLKENLKRGNRSVAVSIESYHVMMKAAMNHSYGQGAWNVVELLREMETMSRSGYPFLSPNTRTYTVSISTISRSSCQDRLKLAKAVFQSMKDSYTNGNTLAKPHIRHYHELLLCYFHFVKSGIQPDIQSEIIRDLFHLLEDMQGSHECKPDKKAYSIILDTLKLLPNQDEKLNATIQRISGFVGKDSSKR
jgi:hypothetical protein